MELYRYYLEMYLSHSPPTPCVQSKVVRRQKAESSFIKFWIKRSLRPEKSIRAFDWGQIPSETIMTYLNVLS